MNPARAEAMLTGRVSARLVAHSRSVADYAAELAMRWGADQLDARLAGLLHDHCRELGDSETTSRAERLGVSMGHLDRARPTQLLHARLAAAELAASGLSAECLDAIARHTLGGPGMSVLAKCVYLADAAEPGRDYRGVQRIRRLARGSLDDAVLASVTLTMRHLLRGRLPIHADTLALYNELVL